MAYQQQNISVDQQKNVENVENVENVKKVPADQQEKDKPDLWEERATSVGQMNAFGFIRDVDDAKRVVQAARQGHYTVTSGRLGKAGSGEIQSGSIYLFVAGKDGRERRWTDGLSWGPSRGLGQFMVYCQKTDVPGGKDAWEALEAESPPVGHLWRSFVSSMTDSRKWQIHELVKKTIKMKIDRGSVVVVNYYRVDDVLGNRLKRVGEHDPQLRNFPPARDLLDLELKKHSDDPLPPLVMPAVPAPPPAAGPAAVPAPAAFPPQQPVVQPGMQFAPAGSFATPPAPLAALATHQMAAFQVGYNNLTPQQQQVYQQVDQQVAALLVVANPSLIVQGMQQQQLGFFPQVGILGQQQFPYAAPPMVGFVQQAPLMPQQQQQVFPSFPAGFVQQQSVPGLVPGFGQQQQQLPLAGCPYRFAQQQLPHAGLPNGYVQQQPPVFGAVEAQARVPKRRRGQAEAGRQPKRPRVQQADTAATAPAPPPADPAQQAVLEPGLQAVEGAVVGAVGGTVVSLAAEEVPALREGLDLALEQPLGALVPPATMDVEGLLGLDLSWLGGDIPGSAENGDQVDFDFDAFFNLAGNAVPGPVQVGNAAPVAAPAAVEQQGGSAVA